MQDLSFLVLRACVFQRLQYSRTTMRFTDDMIGITPVTMETRRLHEKLRFQRYPPKDFCTARYERKSSKKSFKLFKNPEKKIPGPILGQDRPGKNSCQDRPGKTHPNVCSNRRDSESWTDIDRQNQRLRHEI